MLGGVRSSTVNDQTVSGFAFPARSLRMPEETLIDKVRFWKLLRELGSVTFIVYPREKGRDGE